jgi:hypothetical protein
MLRTKTYRVISRSVSGGSSYPRHIYQLARWPESSIMHQLFRFRQLPYAIYKRRAFFRVPRSGVILKLQVERIQHQDWKG